MNGYKFILVLTLLLGISQVADAAPPANNSYQNAQAVSDVTSLAFDTTEATFDGPGECISNPSRNIWIFSNWSKTMNQLQKIKN